MFPPRRSGISSTSGFSAFTLPYILVATCHRRLNSEHPLIRKFLPPPLLELYAWTMAAPPGTTEILVPVPFATSTLPNLVSELYWGNYVTLPDGSVITITVEVQTASSNLPWPSPMSTGVYTTFLQPVAASTTAVAATSAASTTGVDVTSATTSQSSLPSSVDNTATASTIVSSAPAASSSRASTSSSASSKPTHVSTGSGGLSSGATAGIAIACAVVGIALGAIAAFLLTGRRRQRHNQPEYVPMEYGVGIEKGIPPTSPAKYDGFSLEQYLLDAKPDTDIAAEMKNLTALIQQHVENNYHLRPVQQTSGALAQVLAHLGIPESGLYTPSHLASLALEPRNRYQALQHIITRVTFDSLSISGNSALSLLPGFVPVFANAIPPVEQHRGSSEGTEDK